MDYPVARRSSLHIGNTISRIFRRPVLAGRLALLLAVAVAFSVRTHLPQRRPERSVGILLTPLRGRLFSFQEDEDTLCGVKK